MYSFFLIVLLSQRSAEYPDVDAEGVTVIAVENELASSNTNLGQGYFRSIHPNNLREGINPYLLDPVLRRGPLHLWQQPIKKNN